MPAPRKPVKKYQKPRTATVGYNGKKVKLVNPSKMDIANAEAQLMTGNPKAKSRRQGITRGKGEVSDTRVASIRLPKSGSRAVMSSGKRRVKGTPSAVSGKAYLNTRIYKTGN